MSETYGYQQDYYDPAHEADYSAPESLPTPIYETKDDDALDQAIQYGIETIQAGVNDAYNGMTGAVRALISDPMEGFAQQLTSPLSSAIAMQAGIGFAVMPVALEAQKENYVIASSIQGELSEAVAEIGDVPFEALGVDVDSPQHDFGRLAMVGYTLGKGAVDLAVKSVNRLKSLPSVLDVASQNEVAQAIKIAPRTDVLAWAELLGDDLTQLPSKIQNALVSRLGSQLLNNNVKSASQLMKVAKDLTPAPDISQNGNAYDGFMTAWANTLPTSLRSQSNDIISGGVSDDASPLLRIELSMQMMAEYWRDPTYARILEIDLEINQINISIEYVEEQSLEAVKGSISMSDDTLSVRKALDKVLPKSGGTKSVEAMRENFIFDNTRQLKRSKLGLLSEKINLLKQSGRKEEAKQTQEAFNKVQSAFSAEEDRVRKLWNDSK